MTRRSSRSATSNSSGLFNSTSIAIICGVFILGIGVGIVFSSNASTDPANVASREVIDRSAPNPDICAQYGASAIVTDTRVCNFKSLYRLRSSTKREAGMRAAKQQLGNSRKQKTNQFRSGTPVQKPDEHFWLHQSAREFTTNRMLISNRHR